MTSFADTSQIAPHRRWIASMGISLLIAVLLQAAAVATPRGQAARHVRSGIEAYRAGNYESAAQEFAAAHELQPDNAKIAFDLACSQAAAGNLDEAKTMFRQASSSADRKIIASARYNLGCVLAREAKSLLGENPVEATPDQRKEAFEQLAQAIAHYRDSLRVDDQHQGARKNLELLRLWMKHMQDEWARRDQQKLRDETGLLEFLEQLQTRQDALRNVLSDLAKEPSTPRQREAMTRVKLEQQALLAEVKPLQEKIAKELQPPDPSQPGVQSQADTTIGILQNLAGQAKVAMTKAVTTLEDFDARVAVAAQTDSSDRLNELYMAIAPFGHVLQRAMAVQQILVDHSSPEQTPPPGGELEKWARQQFRVQQWSSTLPLKAQQYLDALSPTTSGPPANGPPSSTSSRELQSGQVPKQKPGQAPVHGPPVRPPAAPIPAAPKPAPTGASLQAAAPVLTAQDKTKPFRKAIELAPRIQELTGLATEDLRQEDVAAAHPRQFEALELLQEIAKSHPPEQNEDKQQNEDQQKSDQKKQEDSNQDKSQEKRQQDKSGQEEPQQDRSRDNQDAKQQKRNKDQRTDSQKNEQRPQLSPQQARAMLQRVSERERRHREMKKKLQGYIQGRFQVERDW